MFGEPRIIFSTKKYRANAIGVPVELIDLVDENIESFIKYKSGQKLGIYEDELLEKLPDSPLKRKLVK